MIVERFLEFSFHRSQLTTIGQCLCLIGAINVGAILEYLLKVLTSFFKASTYRIHLPEVVEYKRISIDTAPFTVNAQRVLQELRTFFMIPHDFEDVSH